MHEKIEGETEEQFRSRRDLETKHQIDLQPGEAEGMLISRSQVISHIVLYNIDPRDYGRFVAFAKGRAYGKGYRAFSMLLDFADIAGTVQRQQEQERKTVKVAGGKEYDVGVKV